MVSVVVMLRLHCSGHARLATDKLLRACSEAHLILFRIENNSNDYIQVNICQKLLFLHLLTHNMTTDVLPLFYPCSVLVVFMVIP